jgi:2-octaprenylphenol hydroxylase
MMMASMDVLNKTYCVATQPLVSLRSAGMNWVNDSALVKAHFNHYAMGLRDDLPKLAKGQKCW